MKRFVIVACLLAPLMTMASMGTDQGNGGDDVGLSFRASYMDALSFIQKKEPGLYSDIVKSKALDKAKAAKVIVVDDALSVSVRDLIQNSVATNNPDTMTILINRLRWNNISDSTLKSGIALHEILSLVGLEQTGLYPISAWYISLKGQDPKELVQTLNMNRLVQIRAQNLTASARDVLIKFFNEAKAPISLKDIDSFADVKSGKSNLECRANASGLSSGPNLLKKAFVARHNLKINADDGPIFPEQKFTFIDFQYDKKSGGDMIDGSSKNFDMLKLSVANTEIVESIGVERLILRKNNGSLAGVVFHYDADEGTYFYCYRK